MSTPALWPQDRLALTDVARAQAVKATEQAFARTLTSLQIDIGLVRVLEAIYVPLAAWVVAGQERRNPCNLAELTTTLVVTDGLS